MHIYTPLIIENKYTYKMLEEQANLYFNYGFPVATSSEVVPPVIRKKPLSERINSGRWKESEHKKFLEAIIYFGNDWKCVHKFIKSRSSTQARSHAQKFLLKLRKKLKIHPIFDSLSQSFKLSNE